MRYKILKAARAGLLFAGLICSSLSCADEHSEVDCVEKIKSYKLSISLVVDNPERYERAVEGLKREASRCPNEGRGLAMPDGGEVSWAEILYLARLDSEVEMSPQYIDSISEMMVGSLIDQVLFHREIQVAHRVVESTLRSRNAHMIGGTLFASAIGSKVDASQKICFLAELGLDPFEVYTDRPSNLDKAMLIGDENQLLTLLSLAERNEKIVQLVQQSTEFSQRINSGLTEILENWQEHAKVNRCVRFHSKEENFEYRLGYRGRLDMSAKIKR